MENEACDMRHDIQCLLLVTLQKCDMLHVVAIVSVRSGKKQMAGSHRGTSSAISYKVTQLSYENVIAL